MADVKENKNPQGFYFNQQICIGCRTCQVACKDKNDLEVGYLFRRVESFEVGEFPAPATFHYSGACNHCHTPACVEVCPAGATYINEEDGTVQHDDEACIGCGYCVKACPMRALDFGPIEELRAAHPDGVNQISVLPEPTTDPSVVIDARQAAFAGELKQLVL